MSSRDHGLSESDNDVVIPVVRVSPEPRGHRVLRWIAIVVILSGLVAGFVLGVMYRNYREMEQRLATVAPEHHEQWKKDFAILRQLRKEAGIAMRIGDTIQSNLPSESQVNLKAQLAIEARLKALEGTAKEKE
jgi:hypothetical protein